MDTQEPLVSLITLNYNQTSTTCQFLESTRQLLYTNFEILVCDMKSDEDPTPLICKGNYPKTRLLLSKENLGYAGGNNWGIRHAKGDYILILNNDTEVTPSLINRLLEPFYQDKTIGACSPKVKFFDRPEIIQYAGFEPMHYFTGRTATIGEGQKDEGQYDTARYTNAAHGCAMMVKREVLEKTGRFAERFFLYYEDWDLSARIIRAGYRIWYAADATIYHKESVSVGRNEPMKTYYLTRNRILFMRRNRDGFSFLVFCLFFAFFSVPKAVVTYLVNKKFRHMRCFFKGIRWNLLHSSRSAV